MAELPGDPHLMLGGRGSYSVCLRIHCLPPLESKLEEDWSFPALFLLLDFQSLWNRAWSIVITGKKTIPDE